MRYNEIDYEPILDYFNQKYTKNFSLKEMFDYIYSQQGSCERVGEFLGINVTTIFKKMRKLGCVLKIQYCGNKGHFAKGKILDLLRNVDTSKYTIEELWNLTGRKFGKKAIRHNIWKNKKPYKKIKGNKI